MSTISPSGPLSQPLGDRVPHRQAEIGGRVTDPARKRPAQDRGRIDQRDQRRDLPHQRVRPDDPADKPEAEAAHVRADGV